MSASHRFLRILGCGKTAVAIKNLFPDSIMYDDENMSEFDINSDELTVVSPGIPPSNYLVQNTKNLISEYDLFLTSFCPLRSVSPFSIWISGTNGKTTTTAMMQHLLEEKGSVCGGNIGTPLASLNQKANIWILETSSFTLHYTKRAKPNIYILLQKQ
jgi:UDP-N-acetylmuramoylalanine--D-glutamate ligase